LKGVREISGFPAEDGKQPVDHRVVHPVPFVRLGSPQPFGPMLAPQCPVVGIAL
jgi:hypothetical protein